ncbi:MAG TPA: ATP-binding cassette domain-containing protein [Candidatus Eisenbacteria bacterium]|nr:ATP-binding cassette domain-containing protein [Candidatus Eisenbacteria bacterium]
MASGIATLSRFWTPSESIPVEVARARRSFTVNFVVALVGLVLIWFLPDYVDLPPSVFRMLTLTYLAAVSVIGMNLVFGLAGQPTLGPAATYAVGAYVSGLLAAKAGWDPWLSIPVGILAATLVGVIIGVPALRVGGFYLAMVTAFAAQAVPATVNIFHSLTGGDDGLVGIPGIRIGGSDLDLFGRYRLAIFALAITALLAAGIARSAWGRWFRTLTVSEVGTSALGVSVYQAKVIAFLLSAIFGGLAGALYAHFQLVISPAAFSFDLSLILFASCVIGGLGTLWGPILGTVFFFLGPHYLLPQQWGAAWAQVIYGVVLMLVVILIPDGLAPLVRSAGRRLPYLPFREQLGDLKPSSARSAASRAVTKLPALLRRASAARAAGTSAVLEAKGVSKRFGGVRALKGAGVEVESGRITALIGPNGSGKTTLLNACCGYITPDEGSITILGHDVSKDPAYKRARLGMARTFQQPILFPSLNGAQGVMVGYADRRPSPWSSLLYLPKSLRHEREAAARAEAILCALGVEHLLLKKGEAMSLAETRILDLARALALDPLVLILDEPAAGLDADEVAVLAAMIRAARDAGVGVLLVEHDVAFVLDLADRIIVLDQGAVIADGTPAEVKTDHRVAAAYFGNVASDAEEPAAEGIQA